MISQKNHIKYDFQQSKNLLLEGTEQMPQDFDYIWVFSDILDELNSPQARQNQLLDNFQNVNLSDYCLLYLLMNLSSMGYFFGKREVLANKLGLSYPTINKAIAKLKKIIYKGYPLIDLHNKVTIKNGKRLMTPQKGKKGYKNDELVINPILLNEFQNFIAKDNILEQKRVKIIPFLAKKMNLTLHQYYMLECAYIMTEGMGGVKNKSYFAASNGFSRQALYLNFPELKNYSLVNFELRPFRATKQELKNIDKDKLIIKTSHIFAQEKELFHSRFLMWKYWYNQAKNGSAEGLEIMELWKLRSSDLEQNLSTQNAIYANVVEQLKEATADFYGLRISNLILEEIEAKTEKYFDYLDELILHSPKVKDIKVFNKSLQSLLEQLNELPLAQNLHQNNRIIAACWNEKGLNFAHFSQNQYMTAFAEFEQGIDDFLLIYFDSLPQIFV